MKPKDRPLRLGEIRQWAVRRLSEAGSAAPRAEVDWLLTTELEESRASVIAFGERLIEPSRQRRIQTMIDRRLAGEPLQYIAGVADFYGLRLKVTPAVLIPRPETEVLVDEAVRMVSAVPAPRILDIGTGSGCIALAIQSVVPKAVVEGIDVSADAIAVAAENAANLDLDVSFRRADLREASFRLEQGAYDLVVSNPPYVHPSERAELEREVIGFEPPAALFTGPDALEFYRLLTARCMDALTERGSMAVEVHAERGAAVVSMFGAVLNDVRLIRDLAGRDRVVVGTRQ